MKNRDITLSSDRLDNQEIGSRSRRRRPGLLTLASFVLPVWLALAAYPAFAATVGSRAGNSNIDMLQNDDWTTLSQIRVPAAAVVRYCVAVGSADVDIPDANVLTTYLFTLVLDNPQPPMNLGQERTVQFVFGGPLIKEVTTTQGFILEPSEVDHVIYFLGRPDVGEPATVARDRSLTAVCDRQTLGIRNNNPELTPN